MKLYSTFKKLIWAAIPALSVVSMSAVADDTEVFFNTPNADIQSNILFILDNSGSMRAMVGASVYDPSKTYAGSYNSSSIYFTNRSLSSISNPATQIGTIRAANNRCNHIVGELNRVGKKTSYRMAVWTGRKWTDLNIGNYTSDTECYYDRGKHGENASSSTKYATNRSSQWTRKKRREIGWSRIDLRDFYSANYLNWYFNERTSVNKTRLEVVQEVTNNLADSLTGVNIGLMVFNTDYSHEGGRLYQEVEDVDTTRTQFQTQVNSLTPRTWTPLAETLFEGHNYFKGIAPFLDKNPITGVTNGKYVSPIVNECQSNNIVLLTDGEPTYDADPSSRYYYAPTDGPNNTAIEKVVGNCSGNCLDEISEYMANNDMNSSVADTQTVNTYTVGFQTNQSLLLNTANKGNGEYHLADDATSLETAFENIVRKVLSTSTTFVAPGIAVNTFNRLNHLNTLYFSVFQPDLNPNWPGNLKRYKLASGGIVVDADGEEAVDSNTGFFKQGSRSWWSAGDDGPTVNLGGAASQHKDPNSARKVYTYYSSSRSTELTNAVNEISVANKANLTKAMLGDAAMSDATHEATLNWIRGMDINDEDGDGDKTDSRKFIADPLHSKPQLLIYGGTEDNPDVSIFFGDNQGFVHAINGDTGATHFSFMPEALLLNQPTLKENSASSDRPYGMDGTIASWQYDEDKDGTISGSDHVYIYAGMRRGGSNYYALDVTNRDQPKMLFTIEGGSGDFTELGQTWSKPVKTKIKISKNDKDVLIFAGGYDTLQDTAITRTPDTIGRALYIVDAETGDLLWWAGPKSSGADSEFNDMLYSMPASPKVLDTNGDGLADQIYIGDMGGQVWRFDINNGERSANLVDGAPIASFAGDTEASNRRFYNTPDVFGFDYGNTRYLALVIGSGWRAHPLDDIVEDRLYMLRIPDSGNAPDSNKDESTDYDDYGWEESDLLDVTENLLGEGTDAQKEAEASSLAEAKGWYMRLTNTGEKVLSASTTVNNQIFVTTYEPTPNTNGCVPLAGISRLYHIWAKDAQPVLNYDTTVKDSDTELTKEDRVVKLKDPLPPDPQRMRVDGQDVICIGAYCTPCDENDCQTGIVETFWYQSEE